jgi:tRNA (adenine37-N6)-methyltransferase
VTADASHRNEPGAGNPDAIRQDAIRPGETIAPLPNRADAQLVFIGRIRTPFPTRRECPRQGEPDGPVCRIEVDAPWHDGLAGLERYGHVEVLYWMHHARRDLIRQSPKANGLATGTFSLRSPLRPNPIATAVCALIGFEPGALLVRGLDCLDGTPLLDLKPHRGQFTPQAVDTSAEPTTKQNPWCASTGGA